MNQCHLVAKTIRRHIRLHGQEDSPRAMIPALAGAVLIVLVLLVPVIADTSQDFTINYVISLQKDNSALWSVEYRIPLQSPEDNQIFEENTNTSPILSSDSIRQLMEQSAKEASDSTGRPMGIVNFSRESSILSSPTGTYGTIRYTFTWTNFSRDDGTMTMGDTFVAGMYLPVGASLIVRVPEGYSVTSVAPAPSTMEGGLVWYGPYSFDSGQPSVTLGRSGIPGLYLALAGIGALLLGIAVIISWRRRRGDVSTAIPESPMPEEDSESTTIPDPIPVPPAMTGAPDTDLRQIEEQILTLLDQNGGELYQSEIVERLGLPKSTVSTALNALHIRRLIQKVKKGRENLIRRPRAG